MIRDISDMLNAYAGALSLASRYKLYPYLILSGLLSLLVGSVIFFSAYSLSDNLGQLILELYPFNIGRGILQSTANWVSGILVSLVGFFLYKYIVLMLVGPIMSPLSEKLEEGMAGITDGVQFSFLRFFREFLRGIKITIRNIFREMFYTILLLICSLIPGIGIVSSPGIYLVQAYYAGFGSMDFYLERHYSVNGSAQFVRRYGAAAVTNGAIFLIMILIPVAGLIFGPFLSTIAGTKFCYDRMVEEESQYSY